MKFPSPEGYTHSCFASSPTQIVELYVHRVKWRHLRLMLTLLSRGTRRWWRREWWCGCGAKARTDHRKSTRKHALRKYGPRFFNDVELHATFPIVFHVGRGLGPGNTREKGVLLLETTLDVYKRKLAYQVHREHRFINVSTDEVGQLFFIVFPALINIFFLSFFFVHLLM